MPLSKLPRLRDPQKRDFVLETKNRFLEIYKSKPDQFYEEDAKQVEDMQFLLQRCIISKRKDIKDSLDMLVSMLKWRKERRIRELSDSDFPVEYHMCGVAFIYEPDKYGNRTLYIRLKLFKKVPELRSSFKKYMAYLIYQVDDSINGESWSVIFDMTDTGFANYDLDLLMYLLTLLREYFPVNLDYVISVNFPWVLSAVWTLTKRLIPPERRDVVAFISTDEICKYIEKENVPDFLGGTCKREYTFCPKGCETLVGHLLSQKEPELSAKRIREIADVFTDNLPQEHVQAMFKELEASGRK